MSRSTRIEARSERAAPARRNEGRPLEAGLRSQLEPLYHFDFGDLRIHDDAAADRHARANDARAVTEGSDIYFRAGSWAPHEASGRRTLLHELTHVTQARSGIDRARSQRGDASEREADRVATLVGAGVPMPTSWQPAPAAAVQADPWYRGVADGAAPVAHGSVVHDLGDGTYFSDSAEVARQYASIRGEATSTPSRVLFADINRGVLGRVLDLTTDTRWHEYLTREYGIDLRPHLRSGEPYWSIFEGFLRKYGLNLTDYDTIIGPEALRGGKQMCIRTSSIAAAVRALMVEIVPPVAVEGGGAGEPGEGGVRPAPAESRVTTQFRVRNVRAGQGGNTIAEVEVALGEGLEAVNQRLPSGTPRIPAQMVVRVTVAPDGTFVAAEAIEGPANLAASLGRQAVQAVSQAPPEAAAPVAPAAGTNPSNVTWRTVGAGSPWVRGIAVAGWVVFAVVATVQIASAPAEQRPRVVAQVGGGLLGGVGASYLACNVVLGLETLGWSLLLCGFVAGGAGGYLGSQAGGRAYDALHPPDPLAAALDRLQNAPANIRRLFWAMVSQQAGSAGLPITAEFVDRFIGVVPANLTTVERVVLEAQLVQLGRGATLDSVLTSLRTSIERLPGRAPARPAAAPPSGSGSDVPSLMLRDTIYLDRSWRVAPRGPTLQLFPPAVAPSPGSTPAPTGTIPLLEIRY